MTADLIAMTTRPPEHEAVVLCLTVNKHWVVLKYMDDGRPSRFYWYGTMSNRFPKEHITHWTPLPALPTE